MTKKNMTEKKKILKATHAGVLPVGDLNLPCYVLEDGTRVLAQVGMMNSLGIRRTSNLSVFLQGKTLAPFISADLSAIANSPMLFIPPHGGQAAYGYKATTLIDICDAILTAREEGRLKH